MSRASAIAVAPVSSAGRDEQSDQDLVTAVRRGDDRAFEALFARYRGPVTGYVVGMVKDHARAEDVTQEVFISALRRMRATERPIAFKPWIYEIAKNACIDQYRRSKRGEELSYDVDGGLAPSDQRRLVAADSAPDDQVHTRERLRDLCGAFGDLSESHHRILVLRELEGRSYREIGEEMGMSRPAVESTLFRARRRLTEEYSELVSGRRCERIQAIITSHSGGRLGARDEKRMARHLSYCQPCRRHARVLGVEVDVTQRRSALARAGAWLFPFPAFLRGRRGAGDDSLVSQWSLTVGAHAEPIGSGLAKAAAVATTLAVATIGSGVVTPHGPSAATTSGSARPAAARSAAAPATRRTMSPAPGGAVARRDDRRVPVATGPTSTTVTSRPQSAKKPASGGDGAAAAPKGDPGTAPARGPEGSTDAPKSDGPVIQAPTQDDVVDEVTETAGGGQPKPVGTGSVDTPAGPTPKVEVAPQRPAAPSVPSVPAAPPVSVETVTSAPSAATNVAGASGVGVRATTPVGGVSVTTG
jgi:RNA polymerase sigma factor (sigma-70 family)